MFKEYADFLLVYMSAHQYVTGAYAPRDGAATSIGELLGRPHLGKCVLIFDKASCGETRYTHSFPPPISISVKIIMTMDLCPLNLATGFDCP